MSVDGKVAEIRAAIKRVHQTIYGFTNGLQNITQDVDYKLSLFSTEVEDAHMQTQNIKNGVLHIADKFPNRTLYMAIFLIVDFLIWCLAAFLLYRIIQDFKYGPRNSNKIVSEYQRNMDSDHLQAYEFETNTANDLVEVVVNKKHYTIPLPISLTTGRHYSKKTNNSPAADPLLYSDVI